MFFLVFEGLDGSGKSTLMKQLEGYLKKTSGDVIVTREPGGTPLGDQIRNLILDKNSLQAPTPRTELLLYQASRAQHVDCVIRPALQQKKWVLCDRFTASSIAFQGGGRGITLSDVQWLNHFSTENTQPDLTILLDLTVEESKKRRHSRGQNSGEGEDRIESEAQDFHQRVRQGFLDQAQSAPEKWLVLDASDSPDVLFEKLISVLRGKKWLV